MSETPKAVTVKEPELHYVKTPIMYGINRDVLMDPGVAKVAIPGQPSVVSPIHPVLMNNSIEMSPTISPVLLNNGISSVVSPIAPAINTTIIPEPSVMSPVANVMPIANSLVPNLVIPINYGLIPNMAPINPLDYKYHDYVRSRFL